jgi:alpha-galactosidase
MLTLEAMLPDVPFAAQFGERDLRSLLGSWETRKSTETLDGGTVERTVWTDDETGLRIAFHLRRFEKFPAVDWFVELTNTGRSDAPILEHVQALDTTLDVGDRRTDLRYAKGSLCGMDDFLPQTDELGSYYDRTFAPQGGRSSNGAWPFMNLHSCGNGVVICVGWSGQWAARFHRADDQLRLVIGQQTTHLCLRPGETIRTPRVLLIEWQGEEPMDGQNVLRQILLAHYLPRVGGEVPCPPVAQCLQFYYYQTGEAGEHLEQKALPKVAELGADTYWIDACWYGRSGRDWWEEVGSWVIHPDRFPNGVKPVADAAHARDMRFVLWFEPERVRKDSILAEEHPEFLLRSPHDSDNLLLNLGDETALQHITDLLSDHIGQIGIDIYRQDFNFDPLAYWQAADEPDRVGMAENLYVQGFYRLWDQLREKHPNVWIDNCASGGRRIDLETLMRSMPLWPSDFLDTPGLGTGMGLHVGTQCEAAGLAQWIPLFGGGVWNFEPYSVRGRALGGFTFGTHISFDDYREANDQAVFSFPAISARGKTLLGEGFPMELARAAIDEHRSLQPFVTGDFQPLLPVTASSHDWCAHQLHRQDLQAGFALFFRRHESPFASMQAPLRWIEPTAKYRVSLSPTYDPAPEQVLVGRELQNLTVQIDERPGSVLMRYCKNAD